MASIDFNVHKIFVEGETDQVCLEKLLQLKYNIVFPHNTVNLSNAIVNCKGWTNIEGQPSLMDKFRIENGGKNIVIFDADNKKNLGGFQNRKLQLETIAKRLNVSFDIFLFPNNSEDGQLEDFYASCYKEKMMFFEDCWNNMLTCFEQNNSGNLELNLPKTTGKIYSYVDLFSAYKTGTYENKKTKRDYFDDGLWNFDLNYNRNLVSLFEFLEHSEIIN